MNTLTQAVIGAAYKVHNNLGSGFLENIYEKAMVIELQQMNIVVERQYPISVFYNGEEIGDYYADLFVDGRLIVELKAVENLSLAHEKQLVNYLAATKTDIGLLINFGSSVQVKRKYRIYKESTGLKDF
jgi:GxxExxY protein